MMLVGCVEDTHPAVLSYEKLMEFIPSCEHKTTQLRQMKYIQTVKRYPANPEDIKNELDRSYNSRLKAIIWWYTYRCEN
jgi:hypothetical protein